MLRRFEWPARLLGGSLFLAGICVLLPVVLLRPVVAALAGWPVGLTL